MRFHCAASLSFFRMFYHAAFLTIKETVTGTPALTLSSCEQPRLKDAVM